MSPLIDSAWRVYSGQIPGRDFIATFPPSLYLISEFCFHLFGVKWSALTQGASWLTLLFIVFGCRLSCIEAECTEHSEAWIMITVYTIAQLVPLFIIDALWHSTVATSFAVFGIYVALVQLRRPKSIELLLYLTVASTFLLLSKPNIAWPALVLIYGVLLFRGKSRLALFASIAACFLCAAVLLSLAHVSLLGMLKSYMGLRNRLDGAAMFSGIFRDRNSRFALANILTFVVIAPVTLMLSCRLRANRLKAVDVSALVLGSGAVGIAILGMATNYQFKISDTPLVILGCAIIGVSESRRDSGFILWTLAVSLTLLCISLYFGDIRLGFQLHGAWAVEDCNRVWFDDAFLGHMAACQNLPDVLHEVDHVVSGAGQSSIFFGPGLEFLYASHHLKEPLGFPDWWDAGSSYPMKDSDLIQTAWNRAHFKTLIFSRDNLDDKLPQFLRDSISNGYDEVQAGPDIRVYSRRSPFP